MKLSSFFMRLSAVLVPCLLTTPAWPQSSPTGHQRTHPAAGVATQPAVIVQLPPNSPTGGIPTAPRPSQVAPVSPGQDTYSSTGAVPASSSSTTYSSNGRIQRNNECVRGGVVRTCN